MFSSIFQWLYLTEHCHNVFIIIVKIKVFKLYRGPVRVNHEIIHSAMTIYTYFYGLHTLPLIESANCKNKNMFIPCTYYFWNDHSFDTDNNDYFHQSGGQQSHKISSTHFLFESSMKFNVFYAFLKVNFFHYFIWGRYGCSYSITHCIGKLCTIKNNGGQKHRRS